MHTPFKNVLNNIGTLILNDYIASKMYPMLLSRSETYNMECLPIAEQETRPLNLDLNYNNNFLKNLPQYIASYQ